MAIIIDGYNLLNVCGVFPSGGGPSTLERARYALLNFLVNVVPEEEITRTTVVFDAANAPPGLERVRSYRGITVRFAAEFSEADDLIEILIRQDSSPKQLTVVSSDHRLQRAARRRKATPVDSEIWYERMLRGQPTQAPLEPGKPPAPLTAEEVEKWLETFGNFDPSDAFDKSDQSRFSASDSAPPDENQDAEDQPENEIVEDERDAFNRRAEELFEGFPPGYGEDITPDDV